ncbi:MAG: 3'-5' exoribonuclease YhaM family protein [bacterium]
MMETEEFPVRFIAQLELGKSFQAYLQFVSRDQGKTGKGDPYFTCKFRDKTGSVESKAWNNSDLFRWCQQWAQGDIVWVCGQYSQKDAKYRPAIEITEARAVKNDPELEKNFDWSMIVEASKWQPEVLKTSIFNDLRKNVRDHRLVDLVEVLFDEHWEVLKTLPAASRMHHAMTSGWLEHMWSMVRLANSVGTHYALYYKDLNPPLQKDILIVGAVLHDIGKAIELSYDLMTEASYTTAGKLLGHIVMGRDMIRAAAAKVNPPIDDERLLRLEHAILAHHGRQEYGSPIAPQTLEAMLLSMIDDMDAKVNAIVRGLRQAEMATTPEGKGAAWTPEKIYSVDPSRFFYRGTELPEIPEREAAESAEIAAEASVGSGGS